MPFPTHNTRTYSIRPTVNAPPPAPGSPPNGPILVGGVDMSGSFADTTVRSSAVIEPDVLKSAMLEALRTDAGFRDEVRQLLDEDGDSLIVEPTPSRVRQIRMPRT